MEHIRPKLRPITSVTVKACFGEASGSNFGCVNHGFSSVIAGKSRYFNYVTTSRLQISANCTAGVHCSYRERREGPNRKENKVSCTRRLQS
jgi:hypothetical protein